MKQSFFDIVDKLGQPQWWDDDGVPRYCKFCVDEAQPYSDQVCLMIVACQMCRHTYMVSMSRTAIILESQICDGTISYGDPPFESKGGCCSPGYCTSCIPIKVLEFWERKSLRKEGLSITWLRRKDLEIIEFEVKDEDFGLKG